MSTTPLQSKIVDVFTEISMIDNET